MLHGRTISLRPLSPVDYEALYELCMSDRVTTWRNLSRTLRHEEFPEFLWNGVHSQRVICHRDRPAECLGLVSIFNEDPGNQIAYFSILLDSSRAAGTAAGEATARWLRHTFATTSFRKIYAESTALSLPQLAHGMLLPGGREEGRLVGHLLRGGVAHDLVVLAVTRESFDDESDGCSPSWTGRRRRWAPRHSTAP